MGLEALLAKLEKRKTDTLDTSCNQDGVSVKPALIQACTSDTPDTPQGETSSESDAMELRALADGASEADAFDHEAFEERAGICEFDGGLSREEAEAIAWHEDDRRRCAHCLNILPGGVCKVAEPGGLVSAMRGYRPDQAVLQRCAGYRPCPDDPDQRHGRERWPGLIRKEGE